MGSSLTKADETPLPKTCFEAVQGKDLSGKVFLVTGGYSGLGASTAKALLSAKAKVIVTGRSRKLQDDFADELKKEYDESLIDSSHLLDLADLKSVQEFTKYIKSNYSNIDCLVLNAGVMATPYGVTKQGLEIQMGINAVGHFLLAKSLVAQTKRHVWVSSRGHSMVSAPPPKFDPATAKPIRIEDIEKVNEESYDPWMRYQQSKLANVLLAKQFAVQYPKLESVSIHPGLVATNLMRHGNPIMLTIFQTILWIQGKPIATPDEGARTQTYLAVVESLEQGGYYGNGGKREEEAVVARNMDDAKALFEYCDKVTEEFQI